MPIPSTADTRVPVDQLLLENVQLALDGPAQPLRQITAESFAAHQTRLGRLPDVGPPLFDAVERSGLSGHGGAYTPVIWKWRRTLSGSGPVTVVVNGAESEPVAGKDGTIWRQRPHLVIDGLVLAARALHADRVVIWLHGDDFGARAAITTALRERPWTDGVPSAEIVMGPVHYLAGEASAITQAVLGGPPLPTARRPAVPGAPRTLVHNVETLARLALVARGIPATRTRLLSVLGSQRVVVEVDRSIRFGDLLLELGWRAAPQAVLLGGYGGLWAPWQTVCELPVDERQLRAEGLTLGAGVVVPLPAQTCGVAHTAQLLTYLAAMSAQQCGPCQFGLPALADHWSALAGGRARRGGVDRMLSDAALIEGRGACNHPSGATRLVASAVATFADDLAEHAQGRPCRTLKQMTLPGVGL